MLAHRFTLIATIIVACSYVSIPATTEQMRLDLTTQPGLATIIINNTNTNDNKPATTIYNNATTHSSVTSNQTTMVKTTQRLKSFMAQTQEAAHQTAASAQAWCFAHKKKFFFGLIVTAYAALCATIVRGNFYLADTTLWSSWNNTQPLEALLAMPHQELSDALVREIQRRYTNAHNPADFVSPFVHFLMHIEAEQKALHHYERCATLVTRLRIGKIIPLNQQLFDELPLRRARITHLKSLFLAWIADYKMVHNMAAKKALKQFVDAHEKH